MDGVNLQREQILAVLEAIGSGATSAGVVLVCGGTSAVIEGWRQGTVDIDLGYLTEPGNFFQTLSTIISSKDVSVDMVTPASFVPTLPGAASRHELIARYGQVEFRHFDFYTQALAKLQRGRARDMADVLAMIEAGKITPHQLLNHFVEVEGELIRYPAVDADRLRHLVEQLDRDKRGG